MNLKHSEARYGSPSIALHWLTLILLAGVYAVQELDFLVARGSPERAAMHNLHYVLGLLTLLVVVVRLAVRVAAGAVPAIQPPPPVWQKRAARIMYAALYLLLLGLPLVGWVLLGAKGHTLSFAGTDLPMLAGADKALAGQLKELHETFANIGLALIGLHAAAAIYHHRIRRDNTMRLMMPG